MVSTPQPADATRANFRWMFPPFALDEATLELRRDGRLLAIERKPLEALIFLLRHAGEVVTKDEILSGVWPGRILSDTVLTKCIGRLREVLDDRDQTLIKTVYGFGYRLMAPVRRERLAISEPVEAPELGPEQHPPLRPNWRLERCVGSGATGDTWLARQEKTRELRVFKFARDASRLGALKREITLFRLLRDAVGESAPIPELFDWNLEQAPFFIEVRHVAGGNLTDWAAKRLEQADWTLDERVELVARIADALSVLHSMGVLHKDLKPSNVLVDTAQNDDYRILLCDLGSGGLLDAERIATLGITRMGFTQTLTDAATTSGTPMYLAPEVMMGQPSTTQADLYALGVMLYQIAAGDLAKPLSPGWERDIPDAVLREDIAAAVDGDPHGRLGDAAELARRLRGLAQRRHEREERQIAQQVSERRGREIETLRARRKGMLWVVVTLVAGLAVSAGMYFRALRAQERAEAEAARTRAVSQFLNEEVLSRVGTGDRPIRGLTVKELLDAASENVDRIFDAQPDIRASIHASLGKSYAALDESALARSELSKALSQFKAISGGSSDQAADVAADLIPLSWLGGNFAQQADPLSSLIREREAAFGALDGRVVTLKTAFALAQSQSGYWLDARDQLLLLREQLMTVTTLERRRSLAQVEVAAAYVLISLDRYEDAIQMLQAVDVESLKLKGVPKADLQSTIFMRMAAAELGLGHLDRADELLDRSEGLANQWFPDGSGFVLTNKLYRALVLLERGRADAAAPILQALLAQVHGWATFELNQTYIELVPLARAARMRGDLEQADQYLRQAQTAADRSLGSNHPLAREVRMELAGLLREQGRLDEAEDQLTHPEPLSFDDLGAEHSLIARLCEVQGELMLARGKISDARAELLRAQRIYVALHMNDQAAALGRRISGLV